MRNYSDNEYFGFGNYSFPCTKVLDPYNIPAIEADEDDVVRIDIESAISNEGMERKGVYLYRHGTDSRYDYCSSTGRTSSSGRTGTRTPSAPPGPTISYTGTWNTMSR